MLVGSDYAKDEGWCRCRGTGEKVWGGGGVGGNGLLASVSDSIL